MEGEKEGRKEVKEGKERKEGRKGRKGAPTPQAKRNSMQRYTSQGHQIVEVSILLENIPFTPISKSMGKYYSQTLLIQIAE